MKNDLNDAFMLVCEEQRESFLKFVKEGECNPEFTKHLDDGCSGCSQAIEIEFQRLSENFEEFARLLRNNEPVKKEQSGNYKRESFRTKDGKKEIVFCTWPPGSESKFHDHGKSHGVIVVLKGHVSNIVYSKTGAAPKVEAHGPFSVILETPDIIHKIMNIDPKETAVTLHFYMPPLKMKYYNEEDLKKSR